MGVPLSVLAGEFHHLVTCLGILVSFSAFGRLELGELPLGFLGAERTLPTAWALHAPRQRSLSEDSRSCWGPRREGRSERPLGATFPGSFGLVELP